MTVTETTKGIMKRILAIAISAKDDKVYSWYTNKEGTEFYVMCGTSRFLNVHDTMIQTFEYPEDRLPNDDDKGIVAIGIDQTGHCYTWYKDKQVSYGTPTNLGDQLEGYSLPENIEPSYIVGIGISTKGLCYAWYNDNTVSYGNYNYLDRDKAPYDYILPNGYYQGNILGIGISSKDYCYAWYDDGTRSYGSSKDLDSRSQGTNDCFVKLLLKKDEVEDIVKTAFGSGTDQDKVANCNFQFADLLYHCPTRKDIETLLGSNTDDKNTFIKEKFDCDDFAFLLKSAFIKNAYEDGIRWNPHSLGIMWGKHDDSETAWNVIVNHEKEVLVIDPQNDTIHETPFDLIDEISFIYF